MATRIPDFEREKDFLQMLPDLSQLDPNDPRNANLLRLRDMILPSEFLHNRFRTVESFFQLCFATRQGIYADNRSAPQRRFLSIRMSETLLARAGRTKECVCLIHKPHVRAGASRSRGDTSLSV